MDTTISSDHIDDTGCRGHSRIARRSVDVLKLACITASLLAYLALSESIRTFVHEFIRLVGKTF